MKRAPIICFIGLDGSGKSTAVSHACDVLKSRGIKVRTVRAAYVIKVMHLPIKLGKRLFMKKDSDPYKADYRKYLEKMRKNADRGIAYKIFSAMTTLEFKAQIFWNVTLKSALGTTLLVDRYIYDNAVTYAANLGLGEEYMRRVIEKKWRHAPKPDLIIYIKTPISVCLSRKDDVPDPLYLEIREPLYDKIASLYAARTVSGDDGLDRMTDEVIGAIDDVLSRKEH